MRVETLIPIVGLMALAGTASAAPISQSDLDKRWCLFGIIGTDCAVASSAVVASAAKTSSAAATSTKAVISSSTVKASSTSTSAVTSTKSAASSASASSAATSWSQCKDFDWTAYSGWSWGGFSIDYVKAWYLDVYGLKPPPNMSWHQVSVLVSQFGVKTTAAGPKATSSYTHGCSNPWTSKSGATSTSVVKVSTTAAAATSTSKASASVSASASQSSAIVSASAAVSKSSAVSSSSAAASTSVAAASSGTDKSSAAASPVAASSAAASPVAASSAAASPVAASSVAASPAAASSAAASAVAASSAVASPASASSVGAAPVDASSPAAASSASASSTNDLSAASSTSSSSAAAASTSAAVVVNGYTSAGCVQEVSGRLLASVQTSSSSMTLETCTALCQSYGFQVAGVEYGNECYCGTTDDISNVSMSGECYMPCAGDSSEICGGPNALNIFYNPSVVPATVNLPTGWTTYGVVSEGSAGRALTYNLWSSSTNTIESCANGCAALGYTVSGTEYSSECYCGNGFANGGGSLVDSSSAFMACSGDLAEMCGGPSILSVVTSLTSIPSI